MLELLQIPSLIDFQLYNKNEAFMNFSRCCPFLFRLPQLTIEESPLLNHQETSTVRSQDKRVHRIGQACLYTGLATNIALKGINFSRWQNSYVSAITSITIGCLLRILGKSSLPHHKR